MNPIRLQPQTQRSVIFGIAVMAIFFGSFSIGFAVSSPPTIDEYVTLLRNSQGKYGGTIDFSIGKVIEETNKADPVAQVNLGIALTKIKAHFVAIDVLTKAVKLSPNNPMAYAYLGFASFWSENCNAALPAFNKAIELEPNHADAGYWHSYAGQCYIHLKDYSNAERYCAKAASLLLKDSCGHE